MPTWAAGLRGFVGVLVRVVLNASLPASLLYFLIMDVYGLLVAFGGIAPWPIVSNLPALLGIYLGCILMLGAIWYFRTIVLRQPIHWWEELCDTWSTRWLSLIGLVLIALTSSILIWRVPGWDRELVLFAVVAGLPMLVTAFRGPRTWLVRPGREQQSLFEIARRLVPNSPQERQLQVAQLLYEENADILTDVAGPFNPQNERLRTLPSGLSLRIPPDL